MVDRISHLQVRLREAWSSQSSSQWSVDNPARGQCNPTALVVQDVLGGELLKTRTPAGIHFYNRICGSRLDFAASQFASPPRYEDLPATREEILAGTTVGQYAALRASLGLGSL
jgi:hypothetical protein